MQYTRSCQFNHRIGSIWHILHAVQPPPFSKHRPSGTMLSIGRNVRLRVRLSVCPSVHVFTFQVPFERLFAPTSQSRMSKTVRDSESLGRVVERSGLRFEHFCSKMVKNL